VQQAQRKNEKTRDREVAGYEREPAVEGLVTERAQEEPVKASAWTN
jgi:hypothetical protein